MVRSIVESATTQTVEQYLHSMNPNIHSLVYTQEILPKTKICL